MPAVSLLLPTVTSVVWSPLLMVRVSLPVFSVTTRLPLSIVVVVSWVILEVCELRMTSLKSFCAWKNTSSESLFVFEGGIR